MIKAVLHPHSNLSPETAVAPAAWALRAGSAAALARTKRSRERGHRFLAYARRRGFRQGYQEGLKAAQEELKRVAVGVRDQYAALCEAARDDMRTLALLACQELINSSDPGLILRWVDQALELAKGSRPIAVRIKPRFLQVAASHFAIKHAGISLLEAQAGQEEDFVVVTEQGDVGFEWRSALRSIFGGEAGL